MRGGAAVAGWCAAALAVVVIYLVVASGGMVLLGQGSTPSLASSVAATALVAVAVRPVRQRVEQAVARRSEARQSPYELLSTFATDVAEAETDALPAVLARMLARGTGVARAEVWVTAGSRAQLVACYPPGEEAALPGPRPYDGQAGRLRVVTVTRGRQSLGALRVLERPGRPLTAGEEKLLAGLAAQAGLVLQRAQLRTELALRLDELTQREAELRAARRELVAVQDRERRRLERDIHDGAQQQLVALAINLKLAAALWATDREAAAQVLVGQQEATADTVRTLSDLSGGLLPPSLAERGLVEALTEATRANPVPVAVRADRLPRQAPSVEATLYFCVLEAVQNATKHAGATSIEVCLEARAEVEGAAVDGRAVVVTVVDDGAGMADAHGSAAGTGLTNLRERVQALEGTVTVTSRPGAGTTVTLTVPPAVTTGVG